ncbi:hypothetical protein ACQZV8_09310 [Magnetococcales bacterium HHB-1]
MMAQSNPSKTALIYPLLITALFCLLPASVAWSSPGSCAKLDFTPFYYQEKLKWSGVVRVLRHNAPLFAANSDKKASRLLAFNQQGEVLEENKKRLKVRFFQFKDHPNSEGWIDKKDVLCRNLPLKSHSGLEMKFFIKTETTARKDDTSPTITVYRNPELSECLGGRNHCREGASRFHMYFVFDETEKAVLLADRFRLEEGDILLGWIKKEHGFRWNNAYGLRPSETLRAPNQNKPGTVCSFERLFDAIEKNPDACHPIEGGDAWFTTPMRIPVLNLINEQGEDISPQDIANPQNQKRLFYKVALARPGVVGRRVGDGKFAISSGLAQRILPEFTGLSSKKNVDIFFLLDATASMDKVIDAVRGNEQQPGVIQEIIQNLKTAQGFQGTQFRFGFRVYRDPYADKNSQGEIIGNGVGEGYPLPEQCNIPPEERPQAFKSFQEAIAQVQVTIDDQDDYEENSYGGLYQALTKDMQSCPNHLKLLFTIGDHGYRASHSYQVRSKKRGSRSRLRTVTHNKYSTNITSDKLATLLRGGGEEGDKSNTIIPFFIQTPSRAEEARHPKSYSRAYGRFAAQAKTLLRKSLPPDSPVVEHFFRMGEESIVPRMVNTVKKLASSALIDEIILDIRGGAALNAVIERLRQQRVDIPGVYWHILKKDACGELGRQCQERVFDTTQTAYIEATNDIIEELWVSSSSLSSWIRILRSFEGYYELPEQQLRRALVSAMIRGLQQEIRKPPIDISGETPAEYAQRRGGLPVRRHSPLLSYPVTSLSAEKVRRHTDGRWVVTNHQGKILKDKNNQLIYATPACELRRLALWAIKSKEMLEIIEQNFQKPTFKATRYNLTQCPNATPNGQAIPRIIGTIEGTPLGPSRKYRSAFAFGGRRGYWIAKDYLP